MARDYVVDLTTSQREFICRKTKAGLASARRNRARLAEKYPDVPEATMPMDRAIRSLSDLAMKLGMDPNEGADS